MLTREELNKRLHQNTLDFKKRFNFNINLHEDLLETDEIIVDNKPPEEYESIKEVRLSDLVSENFYSLFSVNNPIKAPNRIFKGGRSSLKSSSVSIKMVTRFLESDLSNSICFRKIAKYLSTSVYEQIKWAIYTLGVDKEFTFLKSPLRIIHNSTNTAFYFFGVDDPIKIKSAKIAIGYVDQLWFEEATEFDGVEEIDTVTDTFIRQDLPHGKEVEIYFTYNPPRNPYNWINEWVEELEGNEDYYIHHSTYKEDTKGFLSEQFLRKVKQVEENDPDYHAWQYLGEVIGMGDNVYNVNLFKQIDKLPEGERLVLADIAIDTGYSVSATAFLFIGLTNKMNVILLDTYYYSPVDKLEKKAPSQFSEDLWRFTQDNIELYNLPIDMWTIDSADGALRNQFRKDYGIPLHPIAKKKKVQMIENVQDLLALGRVYVLKTKNNEVFLNEHKKYQWDKDTLKKGKQPEVIKIDDHTCDAFQYYVNDNMLKLGLK